MATITDIAKASGTSKATVSKIMNGNDQRISVQTRERVRETIAQMEYHPNAMARGLSMQRSNTIGVLTPHVPHMLSLQYFASIITGIVEEAACRGLMVTLSNWSPWRNDEPGKVTLADGRCDGIIMIGADDKGLLPSIVKMKLPCVAIHADRMPCGVTSIDLDNMKAGYEATRHLIEHGHRRIGYLHANKSTHHSHQRCDGYRLALAEAGIELDGRFEFDTENNTQDGYDVAVALAKDRSLGLTALFCSIDTIAVSCLQGFRDNGVKVPNDVSVIGINGELEGARTVPKLTTFDQSFENLGVEATRQLLDLIARPETPPKHTVWPTQLLVRESVCGR